MKSQAEKKQRFHDSLLRLLYPPKEDNHESVYAPQCFDLDQFSDDLKLGRESYSSSTDQDEGEDEDKDEGDASKKLTRAQRKRLRKKKLKEAASTRRKLIGPILPACEDDVAVRVPQNPGIVAKEPDETSPLIKSELTTSCSKRNKQKHRRITKRLASEKLKFSSTNTGDLSYGEIQSELRDQIDKQVVK